MAYLPDCKNDIFISYRRVSNETADTWIDAFQTYLQKSLAENVGNVEIWRDIELRGGETWSQEIIEALDSAAIFLAIIVGTYFDSPECRKELDYFLGKLKDPNVGSTRKILPIFKQPPNRLQNLPREIAARQSGGCFYRENPPSSGHFRTFGPLPDDPDRHEFFAAIERVAQDIRDWLQEFRDRAGQKALGKVFLATVSPELRLDRERLRSDLQQRHYGVSPELEYLWNADDLEENILRDQDGSHLCIHMVPRTASSEPKAFEHIEKQLEVARTIAQGKKAPIPIMVWIQPAGEEHESAQSLLDFVRNKLANEGAEIFECGLEEFKTEILKKLPSGSGEKLPPFPVFAAPKPAVREVALIVEEGDVGELGSINALLADRLKLNPVFLKFDGASPKDPERLARKIVRCDRCLIFWGRQSQEWVSDILDLETLGALSGQERMCVYAAGPETLEKKVFRTPLARKILATSDPREAELAAFFSDRPLA